MSIELKTWYALHTSGTKFYHVMRFIGPSGKGSFSLRHFGPKQMFTDMDKISAGQVELDEISETGWNCGANKIKEKKSGGYTYEVTAETRTFNDVDELKEFIRANFNAKAQGAARSALKNLDWSSVASDTPAPDESAPEKEYADGPKPEAWGSW